MTEHTDQQGQLYYFDETINMLTQAVSRGGAGLKSVPGLVKLVIKQDMWRHRVVPNTGETKDFTRFEEFAKEPPLLGLGADLTLIKNICREDTEALDLIDQSTTQPAHRPKEESHYISMTFDSQAVQGTTKEYALRKLRKDRPDLHKEVIAGSKSPHAAMIEAGFRKRSISLPTEIDKAAQTLIRNFTKEQLLELLAVLMSELGSN